MPKIKKGYYSVTLYDNRNQTIVKTANIDKARQWAREEFGCIAEPQVKPATVEDVTWVKAMGGRIHGEK